MFAAKVIGRVVSTAKYESLAGKTLLLLQPTDWKGNAAGDPFVAMDAVGAGAGEFVFYVKSREAALALSKENKLSEIPPVDAAVMGIIDGVELQEEKSDK